MVCASEYLDMWRIPCVLHLFNLIFQNFVIGIKPIIQPIFSLITHLSNSTKYQSLIDHKNKQGIKIRKIPNYTENRWTSFCDCLLTLYETKSYVEEFLCINNCLDENQSIYLQQ